MISLIQFKRSFIMKKRVLIDHSPHYVIPFKTQEIEKQVEKGTMNRGVFYRTTPKADTKLLSDIANNLEKSDNFDDDDIEKAMHNTEADEIENEYKELKQEISKIREKIKNDQKKIEILTTQINANKAARDFYEKHQTTLSKDEDFIERQNKRTKKIVHKQKLLVDLTDELEEIKFSISPLALFQLTEDFKTEAKLLIETKEKVRKNFEKINKAQKKLREEKKNPVYQAIKEQNIQIEELENSISYQIKKENKLNREIEHIKIFEQDAENEIQDLQVKLHSIEYKREKRQRQYFHLIKKHQQELEDFKCKPTRSVSREDDKYARRLFVGIFPQKSMSSQIQTAFEKFGAIEYIRLLTTNSKPPKYFAQIQYFHHEAAQNALTNLNHQVIQGQNLNVQWASEQPKTLASTSNRKSKQRLTPRSSLNLRPITNRQIHPPQSRLKVARLTESARVKNEKVFGKNLFESSSSSPPKSPSSS
ncbi:hypothetical protein TRFO_03020 [Tritrichomonas foetus]|uniref:RRM domain-containing protein n=1 Tax=Tritrichomonas foetus TaxID=1144522 RepID=A0A1J4KYG2_9EUKA|nr:hypothetical protein TRFO_03020 [Tritrichomonas foetus]|eukprot:OHT14748.1 hypothetical protein TRFO_03020 [Tritrichomonas foetus]